MIYVNLKDPLCLNKRCHFKSKTRWSSSGKPISIETKSKISKSTKGKIVSEETKLKMSKSKKGCVSYNKGCKLSEEHKNNISIARMGKTSNHKDKFHSTETKLKMSLSSKNRPKIKCVHCNMFFITSMHTRWHGDRCKIKLRN